MFHVTFFRNEPPLFDTDPQDGSDCTFVKVVVDQRAQETLKALLALGSFEVAYAIAAVYAAGVNAGQRAARSQPEPVPVVVSSAG